MTFPKFRATHDLDVKLKHFQGPAFIIFDTYMADSSPHLQLISSRDYEPLAVCTTCVEGSNLQDKEVCIKSWSANEGMEEELIRLGIIGPRKRVVPAGFAEATVHDLLINPEELSR